MNLGMLIAGSCNPLPVTSQNVSVPTATDNQQENVTAPLPSDITSGNSVSLMNTSDSSEVLAPSAKVNDLVRLVEEDLANRLGIVVDQILFCKSAILTGRGTTGSFDYYQNQAIIQTQSHMDGN